MLHLSAQAGRRVSRDRESLCFRVWLLRKTYVFCRLATLQAEAMARPSVAGWPRCEPKRPTRKPKP